MPIHSNGKNRYLKPKISTWYITQYAIILNLKYTYWTLYSQQIDTQLTAAQPSLNFNNIGLIPQKINNDPIDIEKNEISWGEKKHTITYKAEKTNAAAPDVTQT